jgi:hypothetical protein
MRTARPNATNTFAVVQLEALEMVGSCQKDRHRRNRQHKTDPDHSLQRRHRLPQYIDADTIPANRDRWFPTNLWRPTSCWRQAPPGFAANGIARDEDLLDRGVVADTALAAELLVRMDRDQESRAAVTPTDVDAEAVARVRAVDAENTSWFKTVLDCSGWPGRSLVGDEGALAAWLLAQHAEHDLDLQRRCLVLLEQAVHDGEADAAHWAYLVDRVRCAEGRPQLYGTQFWRGPHGQDTLGPKPIEHIDGLDQRRRTVGLESFADYKRQIDQMYQSPPIS